jgi:UDP-glucuronate decarboxylase
VTGGAGFLGSHLCETLLNQGAEVICVDNFFTGSKANVLLFQEHSQFHLVEQDICLPIQLEGIEEIYNLACPASPPHYQKDPIHTIRTCVEGALTVLELARRCGAKILQASTSEVYGDPTVHPQPETYFGNVNPIGIRACYDEGKRCAETLFFEYHRRYGVPIKIVRIFNTYGPRMQIDDGRVVSDFILQALKKEPLTIYGSGKQTRSFCFVDDLIDGLAESMETEEGFTGPMNLGSCDEWTVEELATLVIELTGSASKIQYHPLPKDDPKQRRPDLSLAEKTIGWKPRTELREGLTRTIEYFDGVLVRGTLIPPSPFHS